MDFSAASVESALYGHSVVNDSCSRRVHSTTPTLYDDIVVDDSSI